MRPAVRLPLGALVLLLGLVAPGALGAQTPFALRNTDPSAPLFWWAVDGPLPAEDPAVLARLPLAPSGVQTLFPGERGRGVLAPGQVWVGVFGSPGPGPAALTPLTGGVLTPAQLPARGTVLLDRAALARSQTRALAGPLQAWGLTGPRFALDPGSDDWSRVPVLLQPGPAFLAAAPGPRIRGLQAAWDRGPTPTGPADLWIRLTWDGALAPGASVSLAFRRPGALLEWPLTGPDATVWAFGADEPRAVGYRRLSPGVLEARLAFDRLGPEEAAAWVRAPGVWSLLIGTDAGVQSVDLAWGTLEEIP